MLPAPTSLSGPRQQSWLSRAARSFGGLREHAFDRERIACAERAERRALFESVPGAADATGEPPAAGARLSSVSWTTRDAQAWWETRGDAMPSAPKRAA